MKKLLMAFTACMLACGGERDPGKFGLGVDKDGDSYAFDCGEPGGREEEEESVDGGVLGHFHDLLVPSAHAIEIAKYMGQSSAGSRGCYHENNATFNCSVSNTRSRKFVQDIKPDTDMTTVANINLAFGIAQGYGDIDVISGWDLNNANASEFRVKMGYSTAPLPVPCGAGCDTSFASGGFAGGGVNEPTNAPAKLAAWVRYSKSISDYNLTRMTQFAKNCFGNSPTAQQYRDVGRLVARHETMHGMGFSHTSSNVNGIMKAKFVCADIPTNGQGGRQPSTTQAKAMTDYVPGDWNDTTLFDIGLEH